MFPDEDHTGPLTASKAEEAPRKRVQIIVNESVYMSVMVASFGGVHYSMQKGHKVMVHPLILLLLALPVFSAQLTAIFALRVDLDVATNFFDDGESSSDLLLHVKLLMAAVVALINFQRMLNSARLLLFVLNPHSWVETYNSREELIWTGRGFRHRIEFMALLSITALSMMFIICYIVCVDSISVIFDSNSVQECVFNCLAISFVLDLDDCWWEFLMRVFYVSSLNEFTFEVDYLWRVYTEDGDLTPEKADLFMFPGVTALVLRLTSCLATQSYGTEVGALLLLFLLYQRQLFIVLFAVDTGILPAARDICWQFQWTENTKVRSFLLHVFDKFLFIDIDHHVEAVALKRLNGCEGDTYKRMTPSDEWYLAKKYKLTVWGGLALFGAALLTPTLVYHAHHKNSDAASDELSDDDVDEQDVNRHLYLVNVRLERLEETLGALLGQRGPALGGWSIQGLRGWGWE